MDKLNELEHHGLTEERILLELLKDEGLELLAAYRRIEDPELRSAVLAHVVRLAGQHGRP